MLLINPSQESFGGLLARYMQVGIPVPIGVLSVYMKKHGIKTNVVDEEITKLTPQNLDHYLQGLEKPYIFGVTCLTAHTVRAYQLFKMFKSLYPDCIVIAGGLNPTAVPDETLQRGADFVVRGEGEETIINLYKAIRGNRDYSNILGISYKRDGKIVRNPDAPLIADINTIPIFPYDLFDHPKYDRGFILTSRGCPYRCNFCSNRLMTGTTYRSLETPRIIEELDIIINKFGQKQIFFYDDNFCFKKKRVREICQAIMDAGLHKKCEFSIQTRADNFYPDVVPMMAEAGFSYASFGMETAIDRLSKIINKGETVEQHREAIALAHKYKMRTSLFMIFGLPTETHEDREETYRVVQSLKTMESKYNNLIPYPGTPLYEALKNSDRIFVQDGWANFNSTLSVTHSIFNKTPLAYVPDTMSEFELKRDIIFYNLKTYLKWRTIWAILVGAKGAGWVKLPRRWYLKPVEIFHLTKTALVLSTNLIIAYLPLFITEPIMTAFNPSMKRRKRLPNPSKDITVPSWMFDTNKQIKSQ